MSAAHSPAGVVYEIQVQGELDQGWENYFDGLSLTFTYSSDQLPATTLTGAMADQAALRGILCQLWDLNLTVVSVRRIETEEQDG
jgi:hypothetical protein